MARWSLALISPVPIDDALASELAALGRVSHVLAPNLVHYLYLAAAKERYPEARLLGPSGLDRKVPSLTFEPLDLESIPALQGSLAALPIEGAPKISETALFHPLSRTLIVADLVFNIETPSSWSTALLLSLTGTRGRLAPSRVWRLFTTDGPRVRASCDRILAWSFDRLIVAHGNIIPSGAKERLGQALTRIGAR